MLTMGAGKVAPNLRPVPGEAPNEYTLPWGVASQCPFVFGLTAAAANGRSANRSELAVALVPPGVVMVTSIPLVDESAGTGATSWVNGDTVMFREAVPPDLTVASSGRIPSRGPLQRQAADGKHGKASKQHGSAR